jgi:hypothetical protein
MNCYLTGVATVPPNERCDYDVAKMRFKQALEKRETSLSLMEVFNIALKCRVFRF